LRYVELNAHLYRLISIMKMRDSGYDTALREFVITAHGIAVEAPFAGAEAILTGLARPRSPEGGARPSASTAPGRPPQPPRPSGEAPAAPPATRREQES